MSTFGEVTWEENSVKSSKDLFLRLDDNSNELRIITQPYQYSVHRYKIEGEKGFGRKVNCSIANGSCPLCEMGNKPKQAWLLGVISRKTNSYKILDISWLVFSQIRKLATNTKRFGDPTKYDINIEVDRDGGATGYYSVQPLPKEPLSAEDQKIKDNVDLDDLAKRVIPPTPEATLFRLNKIKEYALKAMNKEEEKTESPTVSVQANKVAPKQNVQSSKQKPAPKVELNDDDNDDDDSFPDYNA